MKKPAKLVGHAEPRIAPPVPARTDIAAFRRTAADMGISLMPWQDFSGKFLTALGPEDRPLYRELCIVCARQNGKTTLLKPFIIMALLAGKKIMHLAQNRELPREMFGVVGDALAQKPALFPTRRGRTIWPRYGSGQEEIILTTGGVYRIAAALRGGARGHPNDIVIIDELREMEDFEVIGAAKPTLTMSPYPQLVYLSNAGTDKSVILNSVRARADADPNLAYLEWSAAPDRAADDHEGWAEANPAIGHYPYVLQTLEDDYTADRLSGTLAIFETEHLCRWVPSMRQRFVDDYAWNACRGTLEAPVRPSMAVSMDPSGKRASAAIAWKQSDDTIALRLLFDVPGDPIDTSALGKDMRDLARKLGVAEVAYDPLTDAELAKFFRKTHKVHGIEYANASSRFDLLVKAGRLRWDDADAVSDDLTWTARKAHDQSGSFQAVRSEDDRPITAVLAAIRAVWLASTPAKSGVARIY
jgi:phage terminase large subunit-like protein